jgi:endonuclease/exonuclease/phosphatase family metal-dependent hydrolase
MSIEEPYGALITTSLTVATWNLWGRFGPWEEREEAIVSALSNLAPDIIALQESWRTDDGTTQAERLADRLGYGHWFAGAISLRIDGWGPVGALISRWPIASPVQLALSAGDGLRGWPGEAVSCIVDGPRGAVPVVNVSLDWPPQASALRRHSARQVAAHAKDLARSAGSAFPVVVCGDFNAGPDSAELRMLTGLDDTALPGFVLFDAWEKAGDGPGFTWDRGNRWAHPSLLPSRRIDHVLTGWPAADGGAGDVVAAQLIGCSSGDAMPPSDHYGVVATLRY